MTVVLNDFSNVVYAPCEKANRLPINSDTLEYVLIKASQTIILEVQLSDMKNICHYTFFGKIIKKTLLKLLLTWPKDH